VIVWNMRRLPLPYASGWLAAQAFVKYRRAGGTKSSPLPDFYIGAHAAVAGMTRPAAEAVFAHWARQPLEIADQVPVQDRMLASG
jgi:predicted nucleic acid-binding protein